MNYHNITKDDTLNGEGVRVVLWVSGCSHYCQGCQNSQTWNPLSGIPFDDNAKHELFMELSRPYITGITFSGGDPLNKANIRTILALAKEIKQKFPKKTIWVYSGYTLSEIINADENDEDMKLRLELLRISDVFCDGKFMQDLYDSTLHWVGSSNQNVIYLKDKLIER